MAAKRRLPLLPSSADADGDPARPGWQWVTFGCIAIFVAWLPLAAAAGVVATTLSERADAGSSTRAVRAAVVFGLASALALSLASAAGGFVVGRWGGPGVGVREAALAGLAAALVAVIASWTSFGFAPEALLVIAISLPAAALGGRLGRRAR